ncbi:hypothetical protein Misp01_10990 [Microtetraspora sp. NBRC 13810]|uniref:Sec-independent protein translocase subunit TatA n=1 Tax=Microtetraspora sp. NBRC 13810 TaxID=3030990 RepID=UPI0024A171B5|nr:Sec-independent protein translocase subunit TatA [Microtetraspora sp. NBRC 13810]GLW05969.1 hypothetical protein Misp01_10990 [Microtetraspora sp. NBRC 13810]
MADLGPSELIIIAVVLVLLFGAKKLPDAARSVGRSLRIFRSEMTAAHQEAESAPPSTEDQARQLEERAAQLRAQAAAQREQHT